MSFRAPTSPDHKWLLYAEPAPASMDGTSRIIRVAVEGGAGAEVLRGRIFGLACAQVPGASCVLAELSPDKKQLIFTSFDPVAGRRGELSRFSDEHADQLGWDLAPNFKERSTKSVDAANGVRLRTMTWAADGNGFFASNAKQLWRSIDVHRSPRQDARPLEAQRQQCVFVRQSVT
jgi:hypothetical protein